jgi:hypothetical protein
MSLYPFSSFACHGANFNRRSIPGIAIRAHAIKKLNHPMFLAMNPVGADAMTLGIPMRLLKRAYCVAVNFLFVMLAINAT